MVTTKKCKEKKAKQTKEKTMIYQSKNGKTSKEKMANNQKSQTKAKKKNTNKKKQTKILPEQEYSSELTLQRQKRQRK